MQVSLASRISFNNDSIVAVIIIATFDSVEDCAEVWKTNTKLCNTQFHCFTLNQNQVRDEHTPINTLRAIVNAFNKGERISMFLT
jgi:hypothetical protein